MANRTTSGWPKEHSRWWACLWESPLPRLRILILPYAGGSPAAFRNWVEFLPDNVELWALRLPGRGARIGEPLHHSLRPLIDQLPASMSIFWDKPFVLFGHSLGALLAFELFHKLRALTYPSPDQLFASACPAPHLLPTKDPVHDLPRYELLQVLKALDGIPYELQIQEDLMELFLPVIRADLALLETYQYDDKPPLQVPIGVFGGQNDPLTDGNSLAAWQQHTTLPLKVQVFQGNHFYFRSSPADLLSKIFESLLGNHNGRTGSSN